MVSLLQNTPLSTNLTLPTTLLAFDLSFVLVQKRVLLKNELPTLCMHSFVPPPNTMLLVSHPPKHWTRRGLFGWRHASLSWRKKSKQTPFLLNQLDSLNIGHRSMLQILVLSEHAPKQENKQSGDVSARPTNHQRDLVHPVCSAPACLADAQEANQREGQHSPAKKPLLLLSLLLFLLFIASKQQHSVLLSKHHCSLPNKRLSSALLFALQDKARMVASPLLLFRGCLVLLALWRWQRIHPNKNQTSWVWIGCLCVGSCLMACLMVSCWMVFLSSLSISFSSILFKTILSIKPNNQME